MKTNVIKLTEDDFSAMSAVYPDFTREQLTELLYGEKEGVAFSGYADKSLAPEEMKLRREALVDSQKRVRTLFECRYYSPSVQALSVFFNPCEALATALLSENIKGVSYKDVTRFASVNGFLQGKMERVYQILANGREVKTGFSDNAPTLPEKYAEAVRRIKITETPINTELYPMLSGTGDVYKTFGKHCQDLMRGVSFTEKTAFVVRDRLMGYNESYFSVAVTFPEYSFAIGVVPNTSAFKGTASVVVTFADETGIYADYAVKYIDCVLLTAGLKS